MGTKRVLKRKAKLWPERVVFCEPVLQWDEIVEYKYTFRASEWLVAQVIGNDFDNTEFMAFGNNFEIVTFLCESLSEKERLIVIGHGMANIIKLMEVSEFCREAGFTCTNYFAGSERTYIRIERGKQSIVFCDIRNWLWGDPVTIGKWCNQGVTDRQRFWPEEDEMGAYHPEVLFTLCQGYEKYIAFIEEKNLGGFTYSLSSLAYDYWTRLPESREVFKPRTETLGTLEKEAHYGGFCYAHKTGYFADDSYYLLDCNGLYASVLRDCLMPCRHVTSNHRPQRGDLDKVIDNYGIMAFGTFSLRSGFLPVRSIKRLVWERDTVTCWLCSPELEYLREHGTIHEIQSILVYDMKPCTKEFANMALRERFLCRSNGEKYEEKLFKLLVNNFYGKLAQRYGTSRMYPASVHDQDGIEHCIDYDTGKTFKIIVFCGTKIIAWEEGGSSTFVPSVSAFVTSNARARLWGICDKAGWENVFYNDTDSLIVNRAGYKNVRDMISDKVPGLLSVDEYGTELQIIGQKQYSVGGKIIDVTAPNSFRTGKDGVMTWIESGGETRGIKETMGAVSARKRFRENWDTHFENWQAMTSE